MSDRALISYHADSALADGKQWVHLVPAGVFTGVDGRGPFDASDPEGIILASRDYAGSRKMVIDYNHATDTAAKNGGPAPAAGWIVGLQARQDGIWALVEWTPAGKAHLAGREYRYLSPVLLHNAAGKVARVLRASLTNTPNLDQLTALFSEEEPVMDEFLTQLRELLALPADADKPAIVTALASKLTAMNTAAAPDPTKYVPIGLFKSAVAEVNKLRDGISLQAAEQYVDGAIKAGTVLPWMREWAVSLCTTSIASFEEFMEDIGPGFSRLLGTTHTAQPHPRIRQPGNVDPLHAQIAENMGLDATELSAHHAKLHANE